MGEYTSEDEILIEQGYNSLIKSCKDICTDHGDCETIKKAFFFAKEAHKGVRRKSGEPYIMHPIAVAQIVVSEIGLGVKSVVSSLLHDIVEDTEYTVEDIESMFCPKVASTVDGLTKMSDVFNSDTSQQAESFKKVLLTLSDDVRVILIKIADRLHNMRTLGSMAINKQIKITSETIYLFAPLAYRLGLYSIKSELEDLCLKYRFPEQYEEILTKLEATSSERDLFIEKFSTPITDKLKNSQIIFKIEGRVKSISSIWAKMQRKQVPFEEIYDLFAIRIVFSPSPLVPEKSQCWHIYSLITDIYAPNQHRLRDWIHTPKDNGYEALHATVMGHNGVWAEVQIRSERMNEIAEKGYAAHWKYKKVSTSPDEYEFDKWLRKVREALNSPTDNAVDFLSNFKMSLYANEIIVFTPKGKQIKLPMGASALDFAYDIHTKVGERAIGAKINHYIQPIYHLVKNGDQVEIITADNIQPKAEWLDHVVTIKAKQNISNYLKRDKLNSIELGMDILEKKLDSYGVKPNSRVLRKLLAAYDCTNKDEFYTKIGADIITLDNLNKILRENSATKVIKFWGFQLSNPFKFMSNDDKSKNRDQPAKLTNIIDQELQFSIAECCEPIPGDQVVGYKDTITKQIVVHKTSCEELTRLAAQHGTNVTPVPVKWSTYNAMSYLAVLSIQGIDRVGVLTDILQMITGELDINIREVHVQSHDGIFEGKISVYVKDTHDLQNIIGKVLKIRGVDNIKREIVSLANKIK